MNILITGSGGFIGSALFADLKQSKSPGVNIYGTSRSLEDQFTFKADLSKPFAFQLLQAQCADRNIILDCIVHCATILATVDNSRDINLLYDNLRISENIVAFATANGCRNFIHLSTIGVYPNADGIYSEDSMVNPSANAEGLYGLSKLTAENLFDFFLLPSGITVTNLRLAQVYGKDMRTDRIIKIMEAEMIKERKISVWGNGERVSNFVSIDEVIRAIKYFIDYPSTGAFNVGGENLSYYQLAAKVIKMNNQEGIDIIRVNKGVASKVYINSDKLQNLMSINPPKKA